MRYLAIGMFVLIDSCIGARSGGYISLKNLGCWRDRGSDQVFGSRRVQDTHLIPGLETKSRHLDGNYARRRDSIQKCAIAAWERGNRAFVLQNGGWCGSSKSAIYKYYRHGRSDECGSSGKGGLMANQVYEIKYFNRYHDARGPSSLRPAVIFDDGRKINSQANSEEGGFYEFILSDLGCWKLPPTGVRSMESVLSRSNGHYRSRVQAITKCAKALADLGHETMAMYDGGKCMVVDDIEAVALATRLQPLCSHTGKGTSSSIQLYEIRYSDTRYLPPPLPTNSTTTESSTTTASTTHAPTAIRSTLPWVVNPVVRTLQHGRVLNRQPRPRVVPTIRMFITYRVPTIRQPVAVQGPTTATGPRIVPTVRESPTTRPRSITVQKLTPRDPVPSQVESPEYFHLTDLGCWKYSWNDSLPSLERTSAILDGHYSLRSDAVRKCAKVASQLGYEVFAIQDGGRCASSVDARERFAGYGPSSYCRQDGRGGSWVNQVYEVNTVWEVRISGLGCFTAGNPNVLDSLEGSSSLLVDEYYRRTDAVRKCANSVASRGYEVFALHDGGECLSGGKARSRHLIRGVSGQCPMNGRGGFGANEVYEIIGADKIRFRNLGCWRDSASRAVPGLEQTDAELLDNFRIRKHAFEKCARVAWRTGLKVFALQSGGWCGGSVLAETTYMKYGVSSACQPEGMGGHMANQVYEILDE